MTTINTQNRVSEIPVAAPSVSGSVQSVGNFGGGMPPASDVPPAEVEDRPMPFPLWALNRAQRRAVEAIATAFRQDPALSGTVSIAGLAGALGRMFRVCDIHGRPTYANLYTMIAAARGYGKGASQRILAAMTAFERRIKSDYQCYTVPRLKVNLERLKQQIRNSVREPSPEQESLPGFDVNQTLLESNQLQVDAIERELKNPPSLFVGSTTGASLTGLLERNDSQLMSFNPEAGDIVRLALGRYSPDKQGDFDLLLSAYSVEPFSESRVSRGTVYLPEPCMSVCWMAQPSVLRQLLESDEARSRGLLARFLWVSIQQGEIPLDDGHATPLDPRDLQQWERMLNRALERRFSENQQGPIDIPCSQEAWDVFRDYHNETVRQRNGALREVQEELGRARENAIRLALGQCVADALEAGDQPPTELTADHARRGVALARYYYDQFIRLLRPAQTAIKLRAFTELERICRSNGGSVTLRVLRNSHGLTTEDVERTVGLFPTRLAIETNAGSARGGRPSRVLRLLPPAG